MLEHLPLEAASSFVVKYFDYAYYPTPWHYHPEYEIVLVTESRGKRFIGDKISDFDKGDLALIGPNLPHLYRNDPNYYLPDSSLRAQSIVIHFLESALGEGFLELPETLKIRKLLERALYGLDIKGETNRQVSERLYEMLDLNGFERLLKLLEILHIFSESDECLPISGAGMAGHNEQDNERINRVFEFVMQHFAEDIRVSEAARLVNMSDNAFSRYFRHRTRKTFSSFLSEIRLGHAGKLLVEEEKSVAEICFESGFNNLSNFNRQFREFYRFTPLQFRKQYLETHRSV